MKNLNKTLKTIMYALFTVVLLLSYSCEGPEGPVGMDGRDGIDGIDGQNGEDGDNGQDGNANVISRKFDLFNWNDTSGRIEQLVYWNALTKDVIENDAILFYMKTNHNGRYGVLPGEVVIDGTPSYMNVELGPGYTSLISLKPNYNGTGSAYVPIRTGDVDFLRVVIIKSSSSSKSSNAKNNVLESLKAANINVNDYYAVCDYYGLEY